MGNKKLSIITINRNNAEGLRKTMESVFAQTYRNFEYIVIDGASTDNSVEVVKTYALQAEGLDFKWISEPDTGIYNAMNKGVKMSQGEYVLMLNSGDYLIDDHVLEQILPALDGTDIIQGNTVYKFNGKDVVNCGYGRSDISFIDVMGGRFVHQASFCRRELFEKYGYFDETYRINGDTVFYAKCLGFGTATFRYINQNIAYYDMTGISTDPDGIWKELREEEDKRYLDMYSLRMQQLLTDEEKKIKLYDKLHAHRWSWGITMIVARFVNLFHKG